jgi:hypothetical protein
MIYLSLPNLPRVNKFFFLLLHHETIKIPLEAKILNMVLRGIFLFSQLFFCYYNVSRGEIWYLTKYKK